MNKLIRIFLLILISACNSTKYYLINDLEIENLSQSKEIIAIRNIYMPEYLQKEDLLVRNKNKIKRLPNSKWLESLNDQIPNLIYKGLSKNINIYRYPLAAEINPNKIIDIEIHEFIADENLNSVIIKGGWIIIANEKIILRQHFNKEVPLNKDIALSYQQAIHALIKQLNMTLKGVFYVQ